MTLPDSLLLELPIWQQKIFKYLLRTDQEKSEFLSYYEKMDYEREVTITKLKDTGRVYNSLQEYRLDKINNISLDYEQFKEIFNDNPHEAFEKLFQQGITDNIFKTIMKNLDSGRHTLEKYFRYHQIEPEEFVNRIVGMKLDEEFLGIFKKLNHKRSPYEDQINMEVDYLYQYDTISSTNKKYSMVLMQRLIRDTKMAKRIKILYKGTCQLCRIKLKSSKRYITEAHHIRPYNRTHKGDDSYLNLIVLCPNCHSRFDDLYYAINPVTKAIHCVDEDDEFHLKELFIINGHTLGEEYLEYTWNLFLKNQL